MAGDGWRVGRRAKVASGAARAGLIIPISGLPLAILKCQSGRCPAACGQEAFIETLASARVGMLACICHQ